MKRYCNEGTKMITGRSSTAKVITVQWTQERWDPLGQ